MVRVTLKGPLDTITLLIPEARRTEEVPVVETVRAYVRSDDALPSIEQGAGAIGPILVQGLPEGVTCEKIDPLPDGEVVEVK